MYKTRKVAVIGAGSVGTTYLYALLQTGLASQVALIDIDYLDQLIRRAWFDSLASRSQGAFDDWLRRRGLDPETMTDQEIESFLQA